MLLFSFFECCAPFLNLCKSTFGAEVPRMVKALPQRELCRYNSIWGTAPATATALLGVSSAYAAISAGSSDFPQLARHAEKAQYALFYILPRPSHLGPWLAFPHS